MNVNQLKNAGLTAKVAWLFVVLAVLCSGSASAGVFDRGCCPSGYWSCMGSCYKDCEAEFGDGWVKATSQCNCKKPQSFKDEHKKPKKRDKECPAGYWSCRGKCYKDCKAQFGDGWVKATSRCDCKLPKSGKDEHKDPDTHDKCPDGYWSCQGKCYKDCGAQFGDGWEKDHLHCDCKLPQSFKDEHKDPEKIDECPWSCKGLCYEDCKAQFGDGWVKATSRCDCKLPSSGKDRHEKPELRDCNSEKGDWMGQLAGIIGSRKLRDIALPGSHDAGMKWKHDCMGGASSCNTVTQSHNILGQLRRGSRYFDIRPVLRKDSENWCTGHFQDFKGIFMGCEGQWGDTLVHQVQRFFKDPKHQRELVILEISHCSRRYGIAHSKVASCTQDEIRKAVKEIQDPLGSLLVKCDTDCDLMAMTLDDILKRGNVILRVKDLPVDHTNGIFDLPIGGKYADSNSYDNMRNDQLDKLRSHGTKHEEKLFMLSWTLTMDKYDASLCTQLGLNILDMANTANSDLRGELEAWHKNGDITKSQFPNIVFVDNFDVFATNAAVYLNSLGEALWASNTYGHPGADYKLDNDGHLVVYDKEGNTLYTSPNTGSHPKAKLVMQDDGNLVIYDADGKVLWATDTYGHLGAQLVMQSDGNLVIYRKGWGR